jgi:hypothetical protein
MSDICKRVVTIPQADNTNVCWFNAIIMALLYSQNSRNLLLTDNKLAKKTDKISIILNQILKRQFMKNKYEEDYFKYMRIEKILKYINFFPNKESLDFVLGHGYNSSLAIHKFIDKLGKTSLNLNIYNGEIYGNVNLLIENLDIFKKGETQQQKSLEIEEDVLKRLETIKEDNFRHNPDYIVLNSIDELPIEKQPLYNGLFVQTLYFLARKNLLHKILLRSYDITTVGILTLQDIIYYNGDTYILDSCILGNFNKIGTGGGHAISGITCNNNRYVYNGTFRHRGTVDNPGVITKRSQCDLMKFPWNIRQESKFCINPRICNLDLVDQPPTDNLCFSFDKGARTIIYVKENRLKPFYNVYKNTSKTLSSFKLPSASNEQLRLNMEKFMDDIKKEIEQLKLEKLSPISKKRRKI